MSNRVTSWGRSFYRGTTQIGAQVGHNCLGMELRHGDRRILRGIAKSKAKGPKVKGSKARITKVRSR